MLLSETIIIYLAIGAPFSVNYFLREQNERALGRARSLCKAAFAGWLWPLTAAALFRSRQSSAGPLTTAAEQENAIEEGTSEKIKTVQQRLLAALERVRELAQADASDSEAVEQSFRVAREGIETYTGLTLALAEMRPDAPPAHREMELCRIAGRVGDDLLLAGRCIHRRNMARLTAHQARSRTALLHALAAVREIASEFKQPFNVPAARHLSVTVLRVYSEAINLLSLLEDEDAASGMARLLNAEGVRLRGLETHSPVVREIVRTNEDHVPHTHTDRGALARS